MNNADFDTRVMRPRPCQRAPRHHPRSLQTPRTTADARPKPPQSPPFLSPTARPAPLATVTKPPNLRDIHRQFTPSPGSLQKSRTRSERDSLAWVTGSADPTTASAQQHATGRVRAARVLCL